MDSFTAFFQFFSDGPLHYGVLSFVGTLLGLPYIYLQYKASPKFWPVSAVNALPFIYVNFVKSNFATAALFTYYLIVALQGMFFSGGKNETTDADGTFIVRRIPLSLYPRLAAVFVLIFAAIYLFVTQMPEPQTPLADAFATALSFVSMWLLSRKYIEQWLSWVVVNTVYVYMYVVQGSYPWAALFFIYGAVAVLGYFNWSAIHRRQTAAGSRS